jgi:hypothetical protein
MFEHQIQMRKSSFETFYIRIIFTTAKDFWILSKLIMIFLSILVRQCLLYLWRIELCQNKTDFESWGIQGLRNSNVDFWTGILPADDFFVSLACNSVKPALSTCSSSVVSFWTVIQIFAWWFGQDHCAMFLAHCRLWSGNFNSDWSYRLQGTRAVVSTYLH